MASISTQPGWLLYSPARNVPQLGAPCRRASLEEEGAPEAAEGSARGPVVVQEAEPLVAVAHVDSQPALLETPGPRRSTALGEGLWIIIYFSAKKVCEQKIWRKLRKLWWLKGGVAAVPGGVALGVAPDLDGILAEVLRAGALYDFGDEAGRREMLALLPHLIRVFARVPNLACQFSGKLQL